MARDGTKIITLCFLLGIVAGRGTESDSHDDNHAT